MENKGKKVFFFDFDGTIWFGTFGEKTVKALNQLHNDGHTLVYNSGRSRGNARFDKLIQIPFDYFLHGGALAESASGEQIYRQDIPQGVIDLVIKTEKEFDLFIIYEGVKAVYERKGISEKTHSTVLDDVSILSDTKTYPITKFSILKKVGENGEFLPLPQEALNKLRPYFDVVDLGSYAECMQKGTGKDFIIKKVVEKLNIDLKDTYAFGDSLNDLPMFEICAKAIAIGHSPNELKALATYVTKEEENGVWEALKALGFID